MKGIEMTLWMQKKNLYRLIDRNKRYCEHEKKKTVIES